MGTKVEFCVLCFTLGEIRIRLWNDWTAEARHIWILAVPININNIDTLIDVCLSWSGRFWATVTFSFGFGWPCIPIPIPYHYCDVTLPILQFILQLPNIMSPFLLHSNISSWFNMSFHILRKFSSKFYSSLMIPHAN